MSAWFLSVEISVGIDDFYRFFLGRGGWGFVLMVGLLSLFWDGWEDHVISILGGGSLFEKACGGTGSINAKW